MSILKDGLQYLINNLLLKVFFKSIKEPFILRTFPLLDPPRHGMGCAVEQVFGDGEILRTVLWTLGGIGKVVSAKDK
jgi:hypothetical protein